MNSVESLLWITVLANVCLALLKIAAGFLGGAATLVASGLHSFGDVMSSLVALAGVSVARRHGLSRSDGRSLPETLASFVVSMTLLGIAWELTLYLQASPGKLGLATRPETFTLLVAALAAGAKEALCRWIRARSRGRDHALMNAVAFHQRADALASAFVFLTLLASRSSGDSWAFIDVMGAMVIAVYVGATGLGIFLRALETLDPDASASPRSETRSAASLITLLATVTLAVSSMSSLASGRSPAWAETLVPGAMAVVLATLGLACRPRDGDSSPSLLALAWALPASVLALTTSLPEVSGRWFWQGRLEMVPALSAALAVAIGLLLLGLAMGSLRRLASPGGLFGLGSILLTAFVLWPPQAKEALLVRLFSRGALAPGTILPGAYLGLALLLGLVMVRALPRGLGRTALAAGMLSLCIPRLGFAWVAALFLIPALERHQRDGRLHAASAFATAVLSMILARVLALDAPPLALAMLVGVHCLGPEEDRRPSLPACDARESDDRARRAGFPYEAVLG